MSLSVFTLIIYIALQNVNSLNILGIYPYNGKSHFIVFRVLLRELANKGHNVTVISHFPEKDPPRNYHDISLAGSIKILEDEVVPLYGTYFTLLMSGYFLGSTGTQNCEVMLVNKQVQNLIKERPRFDVIVVEQFNSDCALGIAYKLDAPVVATTSHILMPYHYNRLGISYHPAYMSFHFLEGGVKPTLYQRVERTVLHYYFNLAYYWLSQRSNQNTLAKYFNDIPPLEELAKDIRFHFIYQNFALTGSTILPSNVIEVGGYHVAKAKALSGALQKFVEEAKNGVIYINFGSVVKTSSLPLDAVNTIIDAMNELPQRFIWKWENNTLAVDKNKVYIDSWLPQVDILGHPKILAFFSHAGNGGTTEAIHYGVPMVAMPFFGDQPSNAASIEERGLGVRLRFRDLNKANLVAAFKKVLDPNFRETVKEVSAAWHDRPTSALKSAVFWTEFVARHPKLSFRPAAVDVPLYQYLYLDVIVVLSIFIVTPLGFLLLCCRTLKKSTKSQEHKKTQKAKKPKRQ